MPNRLNEESSPYLLQHRNNPVEWYPWCDEAWAKAKRENKLVLVSIGYSACHWCHVMEHESFENETTAQIMNDNYICIKVDREERPDVDQVYMSAVQLMSGQGGWPLNCFTLPDGRPLYGGTYFPNATWNDVLIKLHRFYRDDPEKASTYARELTDGLHKTSGIGTTSHHAAFDFDLIRQTVENWKSRFDSMDGGPNRAPKFPLPNNYEFLLHYSALTNDRAVFEHVLLTLDKMAAGGIYDQLGGGFARYSVDSHWKVPHFEKMLYDNAQLVSLFAKAYQYTGKERYARLVHETISFVERELTSTDGVCYAALDADSEGTEGLYYTWIVEEIDNIPFPPHERLDTRAIFKEYYGINNNGYWEEGRYILLRSDDDDKIAATLGITSTELNAILEECKRILMEIRSQRIRPGLDYKFILSWNAMMITAWCDAYDMCGDSRYLERAKRCTHWINSNMREPDGRLHHSTVSGKTAAGPAFLEDYSFLAKAMLSLYRSTFNERWLKDAEDLVGYAMRHFSDQDNGSFWYTSDLDPALVSRKQEFQDNVIPGSSSVMARVLFELGSLLDRDEWKVRAARQLEQLAAEIPPYGSAYSNWLQLGLILTHPMHEVVISGPEAEQIGSALRRHYLPSILLAGDAIGTSSLNLCHGRYRNDATFIHVCSGNTCQLPVRTVEEALKFIAGSPSGQV